MPLVLCKRSKILKISRVSQIVKIDDLFIGPGQPVKYKISADKSGASGYQNHGGLLKVAQRNPATPIAQIIP